MTLWSIHDLFPVKRGRGGPIIIEPQAGWRRIDWGEILEYRDMLLFLVWRDVKTLYAQTVIGLGWAVIRPVFSMIVFTVVFGGLANVPSDGAPYAVFSFAALVPWTYFSSAMTQSTSSLVGNAGMITKVYFPRLIIPAVPVIAGLVDFAVAFVILIILLFAYSIVPGVGVLVLPLLITLMVVTALGIGMWLSALAIQYRDVKHAVQFLTQLLMYAAPVVWPVSLIAERFPEWDRIIRLVYGLYPMAGVIEGFRSALLGTRPMPWDLIGMGGFSATILVITGMYYFRRMDVRRCRVRISESKAARRPSSSRG